MNPKDYIKNQAFCPIPWTGLMYNFDGEVKNCIRSAIPLGNIKDNTIEQILLGEKNLTRQQQMLNNQKPSSCNPCYELEQNKKGFEIISDRIFYLRELKKVNFDTYQQNNFNLRTIDIRWSNLCNSACVYCSPQFSSKWASELKTHQETPNEIQFKGFKEFIFKHAAQLKHVYLAGGEPLLIKENMELLKLLKETNPNVNLRINTNLSRVDTKIFNLVLDFKNVHWTISLEAIQEQYEYIRYGSSWENFVDNLKIIQKLDHKISFNMLYFLLNHLSIFDCLTYLQNMGFHNNSFIIGALTGPDYLDVRHLPNNMLESALEQMQKWLDTYSGTLCEDGIKNIMTYVQKPFKKDLQSSLDQLKLLDQRRGLDSQTTFKEFYKNIKGQ